MKKPIFEVFVGNIGCVHSGSVRWQAEQAFKAYVENSMADTGRAAGESVTMFRNSEIADEFIGAIDKAQA